jgi:hypothetical protein
LSHDDIEWIHGLEMFFHDSWSWFGSGWEAEIRAAFVRWPPSQFDKS